MKAGRAERGSARGSSHAPSSNMTRSHGLTGGRAGFEMSCAGADSVPSLATKPVEELSRDGLVRTVAAGVGEGVMRMLVVEDDPDLGDALLKRLRREGHAVDWQNDGEAADDVLCYQDYEVVVLDIGLPGMNGFEILRGMRRRGSLTPVLMLTARSNVEDRVDALDVGADDYLSKPFDFREFDARCRALLRRSQGMASNVIQVGDLVFDRGAKLIRLGDTQLMLPNREFRLLEILIGNLGRVLSKEQISSQLFDFDDEAGSNAIELYVGRLRRKLGHSLNIRTIRGHGYLAEPPTAS